MIIFCVAGRTVIFTVMIRGASHRSSESVCPRVLYAHACVFVYVGSVHFRVLGSNVRVRVSLVFQLTLFSHSKCVYVLFVR